MSDKPIMNGADHHLQDIEERLVTLTARFQRVEGDLDTRRIQRALDELSAARDELYSLIDRLMDLRTLVIPPNWRLRMQYDSAMYLEFLETFDERLLVLALREGGEPVINKLQATIERAKGETGDD